MERVRNAEDCPSLNLRATVALGVKLPGGAGFAAHPIAGRGSSTWGRFPRSNQTRIPARACTRRRMILDMRI